MHAVGIVAHRPSQLGHESGYGHAGLSRAAGKIVEVWRKRRQRGHDPLGRPDIDDAEPALDLGQGALDLDHGLRHGRIT